MVKLSVVIPCYLVKPELVDITKSAIHSFREADLPEWELILVDDGSLLGSGYLKQEADTYIHHKKNQGFIKSVNDGIKVARGELIAVANNDIRVAPNFYEVAKEILDKDIENFSVHPRMLFYDDPIEYGVDIYKTGKERWCQSSFFIIRHKHLFPENYKGTGGAYEDYAYWCRLRREGLHTVYTTKTAFQHADSSTTQVIGEASKKHAANVSLFIEEFGLEPDDYMRKQYPEQFLKDWRAGFYEL